MKKIILGLGFVCLFTLSSCSSNNTDKTKNVKSSSTSTSYKTKKSTTSISTSKSDNTIPSTSIGSSENNENEIQQNNVSSIQESATSQKMVPDYKPNGQYMTYSQYQAALKAAGFTNITLDPQATTNQQADGYVYSVYPNVGSSISPSKEIVATYSVYTSPAPTSSSTESSESNYNMHSYSSTTSSSSTPSSN